QFIVDVQIGATMAVAMTATYSPWNNNCGGPGPTGMLPVFTFPKTGGTGTMMVGSIGTNNFSSYIPARVAANGNPGLWTYEDMTMPNIRIEPLDISYSPQSVPGPNQAPAGVVVDTTLNPAIAYVAGWVPLNNPVSLMYPYYPCCGGGNPGGQA